MEVEGEKKPRRRRWLRRLGVVVLVLVVLMGGVKVADVALTAKERADHPAPGQLVDVDGHKMHVHTTGQGDTSIVLLPGLGVSAPDLDFELLVKELSGWATVTVVEPFGYGWSDVTDSSMLPRDIARDVHTALHAAGVKGPYVLMGHSISGLTSQAFADQYPDEVAGYVGLDPTIPHARSLDNEAGPAFDWYYPWFFRPMVQAGWMRIITAFSGADPSFMIGASSADGYSKENLEQQRMLTNWMMLSANVMRQQETAFSDSRAQVRDLRFDKQLPVLVYTIRETNYTEAEIAEYVGSGPCRRSVIVDASHYVHHTEYKRISEGTRALMTECHR